MFAAKSLACRRGKRLLFRNVGFALEAGGLLLVSGRNGSGKSSLLRILAGLLPAFEGEMVWQGAPVNDLQSHHAHLHYLGHANALRPEFTPSEMLDYWRALRTVTVADEKLAETFGLTAFLNTPIRYLSAGQKRRLALTRLAIGDALLWLLDEPVVSLDEAGRDLLAKTLARHRTQGGMAIIATHQPDDFKNAQHLALDGRA
jgi:heme exporter protein A